MRSYGASAIGAMLLAGVLAGDASALVLDQSNIIVLDPQLEIGGPSIDFAQSAGQTFTVGVAGRLSSIGLQIQVEEDGASADALLSIFEVDGTTLGDTALGSVTVPLADVPAFSGFTSAPFVLFDVSSLGIDVSVGQMLALLVTFSGLEDDGGFFIFDSPAPSVPYEGGVEIVIGEGDGAFVVIDERDLGFQTFVEATAAVPLPASGLLLLGAVMMTAGMRRRISSRRIAAS
ncbi:MAG: hypothetical protein AAF160_18770 [Pseudomonadota bacterium]